MINNVCNLINDQIKAFIEKGIRSLLPKNQTNIGLIKSLVSNQQNTAKFTANFAVNNSFIISLLNIWEVSISYLQKIHAKITAQFKDKNNAGINETINDALSSMNKSLKEYIDESLLFDEIAPLIGEYFSLDFDYNDPDAKTFHPNQIEKYSHSAGSSISPNRVSSSGCASSAPPTQTYICFNCAKHSLHI